MWMFGGLDWRTGSQMGSYRWGVRTFFLSVVWSAMDAGASSNVVRVPYCDILETLFPWGRVALVIGCGEQLFGCTRLGWSVSYSCSDAERLRAVSMDHSMGSSGILFDWDGFFLDHALDSNKLRSFPVPRFSIDLLYVSEEKARLLANHMSEVVHRRMAFEFDRVVRPEGMIMSCGPHGHVIHSMFQGFPWSVLRSFGEISDCVVIKKDAQNKGHPLVCEENGADCRIGIGECIYPIPAGYVPREKDYQKYKGEISRDKHMIMQFQLENVRQLNGMSFRRLKNKSNARNYLGRPSHVGSWSAKIRQWGTLERALVSSGQVRSVLDAGAGSCTLEAFLRLHFEDLFKRKSSNRITFVAFDPGYDCAYLDICGARGSMVYTFSWFEMQPIPDNSFDMVFQALGIHHSDLSKQYTGFNLTKELMQQLVETNTATLKKAYGEFDRVLRPGGYLSLHDGACQYKDNNAYVRQLQKKGWYNILQIWADENGYKVLNVRQYARNQGDCEHVDIILQKPFN